MTIDTGIVSIISAYVIYMLQERIPRAWIFGYKDKGDPYCEYNQFNINFSESSHCYMLAFCWSTQFFKNDNIIVQ